ncbi:MAG: TlpA family protein disulfide reductase [SAR324 cluster bacterium]|nr:TlpA family protein disulfide reductase [SAR324 cluster bacterium]
MKKLLSLLVLFCWSSVLWAQTSPLTDDEQNLLKKQNIELARYPINAENFEGTLPDGTLVHLSDYKDKIVFLNFWATWCVPCLKELPDMEKLNQEFKDKGLVILAIGMGESTEKIQNFLQKKPFSMKFIADPEMQITQLYGVQNIPVTYLIHPGGEVFARAVGPRDWFSSEIRAFFSNRSKLLNSH